MQLVGYERRDTDTALLVSDGGDVRRRPLEPGTELEYRLGTRHCAGTLEGDVHRPCDRPTAPHCKYHTRTWVCAKCTGTCLKDEMDCHETHAVYLAAFAPDTFKVGVTKRRRLETRLREQGADRAAHIRTVENGRIAREIEAEIATGLSDRVRTSAKVESLAATVDEAAWETLLAEYDVIERFDLEYDLECARRPIRETIASGTVRGLQGRLLVLARGGTTYAVDLRDLVGYDLAAESESESEGSPRSRQSSLGSFG